MAGKVHGIRGATTASENTAEAIREVVEELLYIIETRNHLKSDQIISVIFTVTKDLDAIFPAAIAREKPNWDKIPLLDLQQMHVKNSLPRCIRVLIYVNLPPSHPPINHVYLQQAKNLRPDISIEAVITDTFQSS